MVHKFFQWWYLRNRSSYGEPYKKIDDRSKERDLIHYFHDFGGDGLNARNSYWLRKKLLKVFLYFLFLTLTCWFAYESYQGLLIYND